MKFWKFYLLYLRAVMAKIIAVFGATGQQGGAVVRALLKDEQYVVRAITRNPDGESGKALKAQGKLRLPVYGQQIEFICQLNKRSVVDTKKVVTSIHFVNIKTILFLQNSLDLNPH